MLSIKTKIVFVLFFMYVVVCAVAQHGNPEYYIPIKLTYYPGDKYRIPTPGLRDPIKDSIYDDIWIQMLTPIIADLHNASKLKVNNKAVYDRLSQKVLFTRKSCDSLVRGYARSSPNGWITAVGKEGLLRYNEKNPKNNSYERCICLSANALTDLPHKQIIKVGNIFKYFVPKPFLEKFKRYGLDSLDLAEAPYMVIFPMDITPSFRCDKATTSIERAICRNAELASLDNSLAKTYKDALKNNGEGLKISQKKWVLERDKVCEGKNNETITQLLIPLYIKRITELKR